MKNLLYILLFSLSPMLMSAQQDLILTKYTFSSLFFNPAYAGSAGEQEGSILINYRDQWIGLEGSPKTVLLSGDVNLFEDRVGIGMSVGRESLGIDTRLDVLLNAAYRIYVGDDGVISGGLRAGFHNFNSAFEDINYENFADPIYDQPSNRYNGISLGAGVYYNSEEFYAGFSVPAIANISDQTNLKSRHYYLHTGALLGGEYSELKIEPSILLKYEKAAPVQYTVGANLWLIENFSVGLHYRSSDAIGLSAEFIIADQLSIGAAYDFTTQDLNKESSGSMEFLLAYRINYKYNGVPMGRSRRFR